MISPSSAATTLHLILQQYRPLCKDMLWVSTFSLHPKKETTSPDMADEHALLRNLFLPKTCLCRNLPVATTSGVCYPCLNVIGYIIVNCDFWRLLLSRLPIAHLNGSTKTTKNINEANSTAHPGKGPFDYYMLLFCAYIIILPTTSVPYFTPHFKKGIINKAMI